MQRPEYFSALRRDLHHAFRSLRRTPVITAAAVLTLALGVGASTAVFSVVHAVLLRPLPFPEPDALVELFEENLSAGSSLFRASALNYLSWTERSERLDPIGAFRSDSVTLTDDRDPELLNASFVTSSLFGVLRVPPLAGRTLQPGDEQRGSARVVVLGESLWRRRFGGDRQIVGRTITLDGEHYEVVGIMPRAFREVGRTQAAASADAQIFLPLVIDRASENRANHTLRVVGRLRHGVPIGQARAEMQAVAAAMAQEFPATNRNWSVRIETVSSTMLDQQVQRSLLLVLGAVLLVFLIASANVANLMLVRGTRRHAELAVRMALGARRAQLVRQLLTESICLAIISGTAGVLAALIAHPVVRAWLPPTLPRLAEMRLDLTVLAFGVFISMTSGLVFGMAPALRASRVDLAQALVLLGRTTAGSSRAWMQRTLIVAQIALATVLLVSASLLLQGLVRLQNVPLGFDPDNVLTARVSLPRSGYPDAARTDQFYGEVLAALRGSGQVEAAAVATSAPFAPGVRAAFQVIDRSSLAAAGAANQTAAEHIVSGDYFRVLGVPVLAGRSFNELDTTGSMAVAVVSQRFARLSWPDANPLGQILERAGRTYQVIGVAGDVRGSDTAGARGGGPERDPRAAVYFAAGQLPQRTMTLLVRSRGEPAGVAATIRDAVHRADPALAVQQVRPLGDWLADSIAPSRLTATLSTVFALSALVLASIGIYGVLACIVASRTREIGVRMALGATRGRVIGLVLEQGMTLAAGGILLGLIGAFAAARLIATLLFEIPARDPVTFAMVGGAVTLTALIACSIPAARAVRINPTTAMRAE